MAETLILPYEPVTAVPTPPPSRLLDDVTAGPLGLFEPGNPVARITSVPANSSTVRDLAKSWTQATIGSDPGEFTVSNSVGGSSAKAKIELTPKGGLHFMNSQQSQVSPYETFSLAWGAQRLAYLNANYGHTFYVSTWLRNTRNAAAGYTSGMFVAAIRKGSNVSDLYAAAGVASDQAWTIPSEVSASTRHAGSRRSTRNGAIFAGTAANAGPGTPFSTSASFVLLGASTAAAVNKLPSTVLYRAYVEDLTVSGRTAEQVAQLDLDEFRAQVESFGGRYYGDTWSTPVTTLP